MQKASLESPRVIVEAKANHKHIESKDNNIKNEEYAAESVETTEAERHCNIC